MHTGTFLVLLGMETLEKQKILIDVEQLNAFSNVILIVSHPTGVFYTAQTGGVSCNHPECEGFAISLGSFLEEFDDCDYGCQYIDRLPEKQKQLADDLNKLFIAHTTGWRYQITFDYSRLNELQEGWWPVLVKGNLDTQPIDWKGYIHTGNCD